MVASNPAIVQNLSDRALRALSAQETTVGQQWLDDAWSIIVTEVPSVGTRIDAGDQAATALAVQVECAMVMRVFNNPEGKLQEGLDDYQYRLDAAVSTGALYLSDAERELLGRGDDTSDNAFTITPYGRTPGYGFPIGPYFL